MSIDELVLGVNIALGLQPLDVCAALELGDDGVVSINELILAVGSALDGCMEPIPLVLPG